MSDILQHHLSKDLLRFITCGSVDDGKSTLIGRLLYDCQALLDDQLSALAEESRRFGTTGADSLDLALLVDGLQAEREQGITIDVAYRFFSTERRMFIVADTPGHEQYTRNMATGASTAQLALLLIDARKGVLTQTRRHATILRLMGIRQVVIAVNKMDLVGYDRQVFERLERDCGELAAQLGIARMTCVPISAIAGDNVAAPGGGMPWYAGPTVLQVLERADVAESAAERPLRFPVQWVNRPNLDFRGYAGTVATGVIRRGERIAVLPSGRTATVARLVTAAGDLEQAVAGQAVTVTLAEEVDVSRGDVLAPVSDAPTVADQISAHLIWMDERPGMAGRPYLLRQGPAEVPAQITHIRHKINPNNGEHIAVRHLDLNDIAVCTLAFNRPLAFDSYEDNRATGSFILIDRQTNATVACGMIDFALRRADNLHRQALSLDKGARAALKGQRPAVLWFTGLSGAGKSTVANLVEKRLHEMGRHTYLLDGDNVRLGLNRDLGFTDEDRVENIRRVAECAKLFVDAGLLVLTAFISPFAAERRLARETLEAGEFIEIHVSTPLEVCESRDPKGLYKKARDGRLPHFTGIDSPYEAPENPELVLDGATAGPEELAGRVVAFLQARGYI